MAFDELNELLAQFGEADRTTFTQILERNKPAAERLTNSETIRKAFVDGDTTALGNLQKPVVTSPAFDLSELDRRLDERFGKVFDDPRFTTAVETRAKALAKEAEDRAVGRSLYQSDEIFTIRSRQKEELGTDLDRPAFEKFVTDNPGKFNSLTAAYESFTGPARIQKQIQDGINAGLAAARTSDVPGTTLGTSPTPLGQMIRSNPMTTAAHASRGDLMDKAAQAFVSLQNARVQ